MIRKLVLGLAVLYVVVRLPLQLAVITGFIPMGEEPWQGEDLYINVQAAGRFLAGHDLYVLGKMPALEVYHYSPFYALLMVPAQKLPMSTVAVIHTLLTCAAYAGLFLFWRWLFARWRLDGPARAMTALLPLWLIYGAFYGDLSFLNIYVLLSLLASLLIYAVIEERLGLAIVAGALILQAKPQWAFALALPLVLGRYRFFWRLLAGTVIAYLACVTVVVGVTGRDYALGQYRDYYTFLLQMTANFRWRGPDVSLGYNHSLMQIGYHLFGVQPWVRAAVTAVKSGLLAPLAWLCWRVNGVESKLRADDRMLALEVAAVLYLGAFLWLDVLWEVTLSIVFLTYLIGVTADRRAKGIAWAGVGLYAFQDVWLVVLYAVMGEGLTSDYFWVDPATHVPIIMAALLALYGLFLARLGRRSIPILREPAAGQAPQRVQ